MGRGRKKGGKNKPKELAGNITFTDKVDIDQNELNKKVAENDELAENDAKVNQ